MADEIGNILDNEPIARKTLTLFYVIDTSGSMNGSKIGTVNTVMEEVIPEIRNVGGSDSDVRFQAMTFDDEVRWIYDSPVSIEDVVWSRPKVGGTTDLGKAMIELDSKLSRNGFMKSASLSFAPVIFLLSDGCPNFDYKIGLDKIKKNRWFKYALKIAVAIGNDADEDVLAEFTGNMETVVHANSGKELKRLIREITITSSQIGSRSSSLDPEDGIITPESADESKQRELIENINKIKEQEPPTEPGEIDDGW